MFTMSSLGGEERLYKTVRKKVLILYALTIPIVIENMLVGLFTFNEELTIAHRVVYSITAGFNMFWLVISPVSIGRAYDVNLTFHVFLCLTLQKLTNKIHIATFCQYSEP